LSDAHTARHAAGWTPCRKRIPPSFLPSSPAHTLSTKEEEEEEATFRLEWKNEVLVGGTRRRVFILGTPSSVVAGCFGRKNPFVLTWWVGGQKTVKRRSRGGQEAERRRFGLGGGGGGMAVWISEGERECVWSVRRV
jgi:hypothetical protein